MAEFRQTANQFLTFVNQTGSPYHSVQATAALLRQAGFSHVQNLGDLSQAKLGSKGFIASNDGSAIMAYRMGRKFTPTKGRFVVVAAHTDSPAPRMRPVADVKSEEYRLLGVDLYGGGLWGTWFDRGLGLAGKVIIRESRQERLAERLVRVTEPICVVPSLAIHLRTLSEREAFKIDLEKNFRPVICSQIKRQLSDGSEGDAPLIEVLKDALGTPSDAEILDYDLFMMDATPSRLCGLRGELVESPRLDNLVCTWTAFTALAEATRSSLDGEDADNDILVAVAFNNEEIGSRTPNGADSILMERFLRVLSEAAIGTSVSGPPDTLWHECLSRSFIVSADMAHGVHPNYSDRHQAEHKPYFHKGVVIKTNPNGRYMTDTKGRAITAEVARLMGEVPLQQFVVKNNSPCGSTIGPYMASRFGSTTIDIGIPQWAMHSCRETCGVDDIEYIRRLIIGYYRYYSHIESSYVPSEI